MCRRLTARAQAPIWCVDRPTEGSRHRCRSPPGLLRRRRRWCSSHTAVEPQARLLVSNARGRTPANAHGLTVPPAARRIIESRPAATRGIPSSQHRRPKSPSSASLAPPQHGRHAIASHTHPFVRTRALLGLSWPDLPTTPGLCVAAAARSRQRRRCQQRVTPCRLVVSDRRDI